jgi:hypothetical protein
MEQRLFIYFKQFKFKWNALRPNSFLFYISK